MNQIDINDSHYAEDELHEECGVFGVYDFDGNDVSSTIYYGLFALQHRGQESCGIAVSDTEGPKGKVLSYKDMGLVNEVFNPEKLEKLNGNIGVGHVRYSEAAAVRMHSHLFLTMLRELLVWHITVIFLMRLNCVKSFLIQELSSRQLLIQRLLLT